MSRDYKVYLDDIVAAIDKIATFTAGMSEEQFMEDPKTFDAVIRNLENHRRGRQERSRKTPPKVCGG
jgi:uncharacterized protein with HEPN domain